MHSIRLRGPWELYLPGSGEPQRVEMPATWQTLLALTDQDPLPSPARLLRRFGLPTGIAPTDRLRLVIESSTAPCQVGLNGQPLGSIAPSQQTSSFDITGLLAARNELAITLELARPETGQADIAYPLGEVRLEISPPRE
jgi:hypothetical protein